MAVDADREQLVELLTPLLDPAYRLATVVLGSGDAAAEAVRSAVSAAAARYATAPDAERFQAWFLGLVLRQSWSRTPPAELAGELAPLLPNERAAMFLHYWLQQPVPEVALTMRSSTGAVEELLATGEERLQRVVPLHHRLDRKTFAGHVSQAFEEAAPPAPYGFETSVLTALDEPAPRERRWLLPVAAALIAVALVTVIGVAAVAARAVLAGHPGPAPAALVTPSATVASPSPAASPAPSPSPTTSAAAPSPSPGTSCALVIPNEPAVAAPTSITAARVGSDGSRDRFVLEFAGPIPPIELHYQASPTFVRDAAGDSVTLAGSVGWKLVLKGATEGSSPDLPTTYPMLREARNIGDFEGTVTWALGVASPNACPKITTLSGPNRLVIDFPR